MHIIYPDKFIDIHCHSNPDSEVSSIINIDTRNFKPVTNPTIFYTLGIHPWYIQQQNIDQALAKITTAINDTNLLAIGECGLDKAIATDFDLQLTVFKQQILLAEQYHKPLIIHCVRAFNELLSQKKSMQAKQTWIIHGFNGNLQLATQLIKQGCYLSLGGSLLRDGSKARLILPQISLERIFLETDASELAISAIYAGAAKLLGLELPVLQQQIYNNFQRVFLT